MSKRGDKMNERLLAHLAALGWANVYADHGCDTSRPSTRGECAQKSPFPWRSDSDPSFSVNIDNGLWRDMGAGLAGNFIQYLQWNQEDPEYNANGEVIPLDYHDLELMLLERYNLVTLLNADQMRVWQEDLGVNWVTELGQHTGTKVWTPQGLGVCEVGWHRERGYFVLPIYTLRNKLVNAKLYRPGAKPKNTWLFQELTSNRLFPRLAYKEPSLVLVEGEPDVITLRSFGFPACSGTHGAEEMVPGGRWWVGRKVYVLGDRDKDGERGVAAAIEKLLDGAAEVYLCHLPNWPNMPKGADTSDFVYHLYAECRLDVPAIEAQLQSILDAGVLQEVRDARLDADATPIPFRELFNAKHGETPLQVRAKVVAQLGKVYKLANQVLLTCANGQFNYCQNCPMHVPHSGRHLLDLELRTRAAMSLINITDGQQVPIVKRVMGIPMQCPALVVDAKSYVNVRPLALMSPTPNLEDHSVDLELADCEQREALFVSPDVDKLEDNTDYEFVGFNYASPKDQQATFWAGEATPLVKPLSAFAITDDVVNLLRQFQPAPGQTPWQKLHDVVNDLAASVTLIRGRADLHLAYRSVWHSVLAYTFCGTIVERGWLEALVVGDTRCGKSAAFKAMASLYALGVLVDCKNQTPAGILGGCSQSALTGEHIVLPGVMPQNDGRLVCFDEFQSVRWDQDSMLRALASARSDGIVRINKIKAAAFKARVRSLWLSNPGQGRLLSELGGQGVDYITSLIPQPEDIARFDFAMVVAQHEVPRELLNQQAPPQPARYSRDAHRALIAWTYSRKPEQVYFTEEAEAAVMKAANYLTEQYTATAVQLVAPADQRNKTAKLAISVAAQCFSCSEDGQSLVVKLEHVQCAFELFHMWYDKQSMGYDVFCAKARLHEVLRSPDDIAQLFRTLGDDARNFASQLLDLREIGEREFLNLCPQTSIMPQTVLHKLLANRALVVAKQGRKSMYEPTPAFVRWLREMLAR